MKTYVWSIPTRIFHWLLVLGITVSYISIELGNYLSVHLISGLTLGLIILFRLLWGFIGPRYSHFRDFTINPKTIIEHLKNAHGKVYVGHNPLASAVMLGIILDIAFMVMSGVMLVASNPEKLFIFSVNSANHNLFMEIHEVMFSLLMVLVGAHILGLIIDRVKNREAETIRSIFTGFKKIEGKGIVLTNGQKFAAILFGLLLILFLLIMVGNKKLTSIQHHNQSVELVDKK